MAGELLAQYPLYDEVYTSTIPDTFRRLSWNGGACSEHYQFTVQEDLFLVATLFNAVVIYFGYQTDYPESTGTCFTCLPLYAREGKTRPK